jgi:hypothetical protein
VLGWSLLTTLARSRGIAKARRKAPELQEAIMLEVRRNPEWSDILCVAITERNRQPPHQPKWDAAFTISGPRVAPELDEEEFAARSQLKWTRAGHAWILLYRRRRMGRVVPDRDHPGMWRSVKVDGTLSDVANLSWSKDAVLAQAARDVAYERANTPSKPQQNRGSFRPKSSPMRLNAA